MSKGGGGGARSNAVSVHARASFAVALLASLQFSVAVEPMSASADEWGSRQKIPSISYRAGCAGWSRCSPTLVPLAPPSPSFSASNRLLLLLQLVQGMQDTSAHLGGLLSQMEWWSWTERDCASVKCMKICHEMHKHL